MKKMSISSNVEVDLKSKVFYYRRKVLESLPDCEYIILTDLGSQAVFQFIEEVLSDDATVTNIISTALCAVKALGNEEARTMNAFIKDYLNAFCYLCNYYFSDIRNTSSLSFRDDCNNRAVRSSSYENYERVCRRLRISGFPFPAFDKELFSAACLK